MYRLNCFVYNKNIIKKKWHIFYIVYNTKTITKLLQNYYKTITKLLYKYLLIYYYQLFIIINYLLLLFIIIYYYIFFIFKL